VVLLFPAAYHTRFLLLCLGRVLRHLGAFLHLRPLVRWATEQVVAKSSLEVQRKFDDVLRQITEEHFGKENSEMLRLPSADNGGIAITNPQAGQFTIQFVPADTVSRAVHRRPDRRSVPYGQPEAAAIVDALIGTLGLAENRQQSRNCRDRANQCQRNTNGFSLIRFESIG